MSTTRISACSVRPPAQPAQTPTRMPKAAAMPAEAKPTISDRARYHGMEAERTRRLGGTATGWVEQSLKKMKGPVIAASDYVSAVADLIRPYVPGKYVALGTDGFGRSDTRAALRAFFEVDARSIALAALAALEHPSVGDARKRYGVDPGLRAAWQR